MGENAREEAPFPLTDVDRWVLSQTDEEFTYHTWDELRELLRTTIRPFCYQFVGLGTNAHQKPTTSRSSRESRLISAGT